MKTTKGATRTQTAAWQYDSADYAAGMDNKDHPSYKALATGGNQHTGHSNDGRLVNKGRGPTKGNTGSLVQGPKTPPTSAVPASVKIKNPDYINGGAQVRTPGGTRSFDPKKGQNYSGNADRINEGRGPTKGNSQ